MVGGTRRQIVGITALLLALTVVVPSSEVRAGEMCAPITIESMTQAVQPPAADGDADCEPFVYPMTYPLAVTGRVISEFGDVRDNGERLHKGTDLSAPALTPVLAAHGGVVAYIEGRAGTDECCWMALEHDDGWESWYIHLNNDTYGTDDGLGRGIRVDLEVGDRVTAGDVLGWVGDSGNAEDTNYPHLHFELHDATGVAVDASASLAAAATLARQSAAQEPPSDGSGHLYGWVFDYLASRGILWACEPGQARSCPEDRATPEDLADLAALLTGSASAPLLTGALTERGSPVRDAVSYPFVLSRLVGCDTDGANCAELGVSQAELARLAAAAVRYRIGPETHLAVGNGVDWEMTLMSRSYAQAFLIQSGTLGSCNLPLDARSLLSRGQAAYLLVAWMGDLKVASCPEPAESPL